MAAARPEPRGSGRRPVEEEKPEGEAGTYLHPFAWGQPEELSIEWARHPETMRLLRGETADR